MLITDKQIQIQFNIAYNTINSLLYIYIYIYIYIYTINSLKCNYLLEFNIKPGHFLLYTNK